MPAYSISIYLFLLSIFFHSTFYTLNLFRARRLLSTELVPNRTRNGTRLIALHTRRDSCGAKRHVSSIFSFFASLIANGRLNVWLSCGRRSANTLNSTRKWRFTLLRTAKKWFYVSRFLVFIDAASSSLCTRSAQFHFDPYILWGDGVSIEICIAIQTTPDAFLNLMHINDCAFLRPSAGIMWIQWRHPGIDCWFREIGERNYQCCRENAATHLTIPILYFIYWP